MQWGETRSTDNWTKTLMEFSLCRPFVYLVFFLFLSISLRFLEIHQIEIVTKEIIDVRLVDMEHIH